MNHTLHVAGVIALSTMSASIATADVARLDWLSITPGARVVRVVLPAPSAPHVFPLENPPRLVIDVAAVDRLPGVGPLPPWLVGTGMTGIRHAQFRNVTEGAIARVVFDLDGPPRFTVDFAIDRAIVTLEMPGAKAAPSLTVGELPAETARDAMAAADEPDDDAENPYVERESSPPSDVAPPPPPEPRGQVEVPDDLRAARAEITRSRRAVTIVHEAESAYASGAIDEALEGTDRALSHYPDAPASGSARLLAADALFERDLEVDAYRKLASVLDDGASTRADLDGAIVRVMRRRPPTWKSPAYVTVIELAMEHARNDTERARLGGRFGVHLARSEGDLARAISLLEKGLASKPNAPLAAEFHAALGYYHQRLKDFARAAKAYSFAHELVAQSSPNRARELKLRAADVWYRAGETPKAGKAYADVAHDENASDSDRAWAHFQEANCHFRARRFDLAAQRYRDLLSAYPLGTWSKGARIRLALIEKKVGKPPADPVSY